MLMMNSNPAIAAQFEGNPWIQAERAKMERTKKFVATSAEDKRRKDKEAWSTWLEMYRTRISDDIVDQTDEIHLAMKTRIEVMNSNNPRFVLRNYIAENAIKAAEKGDFSMVKHVLSVLQSPYAEDLVQKPESERNSREAQPDCYVPDHCQFSFDDKPPSWGLQLRVT